MKNFSFFLAASFILSLVFAGNSFSQLNARGGVLYSRPEPKCLASVMISSERRTPQGIRLAEISDLVIDPSDGLVSKVVVTRKRGMGFETLVIPFSDVAKNADATYRPEDVYRFTGKAPYWPLRLGSEEEPEAALTASKLIGAKLRDHKGKDLGQIDDLVINHMEGHVVSLIVIGKAGRPVLVPFSALSEISKGVFTLKSS